MCKMSVRACLGDGMIACLSLCCSCWLQQWLGVLHALCCAVLSCAAACCVSPQYQTAVVRVPTHVREEAAKLHRVKQRLQQKQGDREPSLEEVADAAGISLQRAQRALQATGGALQVTPTLHLC